MTIVVIDAAMREKLQAAGESVELRDESGTLIAYAIVHTPVMEQPYIVGGEAPSRSPKRGLYERSTDRSRKVMQLANQEAIRFRHEYIGTEHMLLGLIAEGAGVAANILRNLDVDVRKVRQEVEKIILPGPGEEQVVMGRLPHTPRTKKVIEYAIEEASKLQHNYIGTEHLLLGLLCEEEGVAAQVLMHLGLSLEGVRTEVMRLLGDYPV